MKVFISWSGKESRGLAESLRAWLPNVLLTGIQVFVSSQDIEKGQRGLSVIAASLDEIDYGLVLLTKENQHAPWINFESGALGKSVGEARVSPLLVDLTQADVTGPLQQFQMTSLSDPEDVWKLMIDMNKLLDNSVPESAMRVLFDKAWPKLETAITHAQRGSGPVKTTRASDEILDEILFRIRRLEKNTSGESAPLGPTGMTREKERRLVNEVFSAINPPEGTNLRGGMLLGPEGPIIVASAPAESEVNTRRLQRIADVRGVRIRLEELGIEFEPRGDEHSDPDDH